jgi:hypothetical protein
MNAVLGTGLLVPFTLKQLLTTPPPVRKCLVSTFYHEQVSRSVTYGAKLCFATMPFETSWQTRTRRFKP